MSAIEAYLQAHVAGAAAGADLFARSARGQLKPEIGDLLAQIHRQVEQERDTLRRIMADLDVDENQVLSLAARAAERVGRLKPNGSLLHRTPLTDLVEIEALRNAVAGKIAGWEALLSIVEEEPRLDREQLQDLLDQGRAQHDQLRDAHALVAHAALTSRAGGPQEPT